MKAIVIARFGGPDVLELRDVPAPEPGAGEARVRVRATAVNRADLLQRMGAYAAPPDAPQDIPGLEFAGEVDAVGRGVDLPVGTRVFALAGGGTYAEHVVVHARTLARIPAGMSFVDAAAVPEAFLTAYDAMVAQGRLAAGECVLVHAVGSGVGTAAVQIARAIGARAVGTSRTADKIERARDLGMTAGIVTTDGKFADRLPEPPDVILDLVGGAYVAEDVRCAARRGRIIVVGLMAGTRADVDFALVLHKRLEIRGTVLRARPLEEKIHAGQMLERNIAPLLAAGTLRPIVDRVLPLAVAAQAHAAMGANEGFGKMVLTVD
jgi:putative PIG3 family NAD(P)H quinone oxidoreductase